jgi:large subunit ribosomal protein L25
MKTATLSVSTRTQTGKSAAKHARQSGLVPAVIYGRGRENANVTVALDELKRLLHTSHEGALVELAIDGAKKTVRAMIKEISRDALNGEYLHLDFMTIAAGEKLEINVPLRLEGEAPGVREGGVLNIVHYEIPLLCDVDSIPDEIVLDISEAHIGFVFRAGDLVLPPGTSLEHHLQTDDAIYTVRAPHIEIPKVEEVAEEEVEGEPELVGKSEEEEEKGKEEEKEE